MATLIQPREARRSAYQRGYTKGWDKQAKAFRMRYPLCGDRPNGQAPVMSRCYELRVSTNNKLGVVAAEQTDHVVPHRGDQRLFWDIEGNWQSLCAECGARKSQAGL